MPLQLPSVAADGSQLICELQGVPEFRALHHDCCGVLEGIATGLFEQAALLCIEEASF
jgi:hypothetical protein